MCLGRCSSRCNAVGAVLAHRCRSLTHRAYLQNGGGFGHHPVVRARAAGWAWLGCHRPHGQNLALRFPAPTKPNPGLEQSQLVEPKPHQRWRYPKGRKYGLTFGRDYTIASSQPHCATARFFHITGDHRANMPLTNRSRTTAPRWMSLTFRHRKFAVQTALNTR